MTNLIFLADKKHKMLAAAGNTALTREESKAAGVVYATNQRHYEEKYSTLDPSGLIERARDLTFFHEAIHAHTSWFGLYLDGFQKQVANKTVLELGAGDGLNALLMARLGAKVIAIEISQSAVDNLSRAADTLGLEVTALCGDLLEMDLPTVDYVVGKAFLHHLTHETEDRVLRKAAASLDPSGEARFFEPAVNSRMLDTLRWMVPVTGRPSSLRRVKFAKWKQNDPHPDRDNSSSHYAEAAAKHFGKVRIVPLGGIERFRRLAGHRRWGLAFGRSALAFERRFVPEGIHRHFARCQLIVMSAPLHKA